MPIDLNWDYNAGYQARLMRAFSVHLDEVLDVGCGAGSFATFAGTRWDRPVDRSRDKEMERLLSLGATR